jgi:molybdate transport system substrate-binding protein
MEISGEPNAPPSPCLSHPRGERKRIGRVWFFVLACVINIAPLSRAAESPPTLTVAAASDLQFALGEIASAFEKATGSNVQLSFGASGSFVAQISAGAPFDLFFSADETYPRRLIETGLAVPESFHRYATGRLVLWVPKDSPIDVAKEGMQALFHPTVRKIAIANPAHAPYGKAAVAALQSSGLYERVQSRLILGENISQAAQFVQSGNAEIGLLSLSHANAVPMREKGRFWPVSPEAYPPLHQGVVILRRSRQAALSQALIDFIKGGEGKAILEQYGFTLPSEAK